MENVLPVYEHGRADLKKIKHKMNHIILCLLIGSID